MMTAAGGGVDAWLLEQVNSGLNQWSSGNTGNGGGSVVDADGNIYVQGRWDLGGNVYLTVGKFAPDGTQTFIKRTDIQTNDTGRSTVDSNGNIILTAADYLVKMTPAGAVSWAKRVTGGTYPIYLFFNCVTDSSDNVIALGWGSVAGDLGWIVFKFNSSGTLQWSKAFRQNSNTLQQGSITVDSNDNIIIAGRGGYFNYGMNLMKINSSGTVQWSRFYGNNDGRERAYSVATDSNDDIIMCGDGNRNRGAGGTDAVIVKYNSSGTIQWYKALGGTSTDIGDFVTTDGTDIYHAATIRDTTANEYFCTFQKLNSSGTQQWQTQLKSTAGGVVNPQLKLGQMTVSPTGALVSTGLAAVDYGVTEWDAGVFSVNADGSVGTFSPTPQGSFTYVTSSVTFQNANPYFVSGNYNADTFSNTPTITTPTVTVTDYSGTPTNYLSTLA